MSTDLASRLAGLTPEKRALFELALRRREREKAQPEPAAPGQRIRRRPHGAVCPLSIDQERLWFVQQLDHASPIYNIYGADRFLGTLDVSAFRQALAEVVRRHEVLRTSFHERDGRPVQEIAAELEVTVPVVDLGGLGEEAREAEAQRLAGAAVAAPFDLTRLPLFRLLLLRLSAEDHVCPITLHHIVTDWISYYALEGELITLYECYRAGLPSPLPEPPLQFADFALWQRERLADESLLAGQLEWWRERLAGAPDMLPLPTDRPRPVLQTPWGARRRLILPRDQSEALRRLAQAEGVTLFVAGLAVFKVLLSRLSGEEKLIVGTPMAYRQGPELQGVLGFFLNQLVLFTDLGGDPPFREALGRLRDVALGAYAHQDLPFARLVEALHPERDPSRIPFTQVVFLLLNPTQLGRPAIGGLTAEHYWVDAHRTQFDMTFALWDYESGLTGFMEYNVDLFDATTIDRMKEQFRVLLEGILEDPGRRLSELPLLPEAQRHQLLHEWAAGPLLAHPRLGLGELLAAPAAREPGAPAVVCDGERLTQGELVARAGRLARHLRRLGVGPETVVGLFLERSPEAVVALLAVLQAGGAYLPLDTSHPAERLRFVLDDSGARVVLTTSSLLAGLPGLPAPLTPGSAAVLDGGEHAGAAGGAGREIVCLDLLTGLEDLEGRESREQAPSDRRAGEAPASPRDGGEQGTPGAAGDRPVPLGDQTLAYIIYTSGSTGTPKGVMVHQRGVVNYLSWAAGAYRVAEGSGAPVHSSLGFDLTVTSLLAPLAAGRPAVLIPERRALDGLTAALAAAPAFSLVKITPAHLEALRQLLPAASAPGATAALVVGGEALLGEHLAAWRENAPATRLINEYGPTETVVGSCVHEVPPGPVPAGAVPIGRPIANTRVYLLDPHLNPVAPGAHGEIFLGGDGVARGYRNAPDLTAARFVPDPWGPLPGGRLYRTGDLARFRPSGELEFLRRIDAQLKLRGFRIEPAEVEAALARHPRVSESAVVARDGKLVAFVVGPRAGELRAQQLKDFLRERLPEYLVPDELVELPALPLTGNGKVDRAALAAGGALGPHALDEARAPASPRNFVEETLAAIWAEVLHRPRVGIHDNFFDLGGHSLLAIQVISRVRDSLQVQLRLHTIFEAPTVAALARRLRAGSGAGSPGAGGAREAEAAMPASIPPRSEELRRAGGPLSFAQQRLWFFDRLAPGNPVYNMYYAVRIAGALALPALRQALAEVVRRQEQLRTRFVEVAGRPVQMLVPAGPHSLPIVDLSALPAASPAAAGAPAAPAVSSTPPVPATPATPASLRERERLSVAESRRPFDLAAGPLLRTCLLRLGEQEWALSFTLHHIVSDGWSMGVLGYELGVLYDAFAAGRPSPLPELPLHTSDFAAWQRDEAGGAVLAGQLAALRGLLAGAPPLLALPLDRPRPPVASFRGGRSHRFALARPLVDRLRALSRGRGATLFMTLLAAFKVLLARYSGEDDILVGAPSANRTRTEIESLIGFFVNTLVLRTRLAGDPSVADLIARVRAAALGAFAHQDLPFEKLVEELAPRRDLAYNPLAQVMFSMQDYPQSAPVFEGLEVSGLAGDAYDTGTSKFDLTLFLWEAGEGGLGALLEFNRDLFDAATASRLLARYETLLGGLATLATGTPVSRLALLDEAERAQLLREWAGMAAGGTPPATACLHHLFAAQAARTPAAPALSWPGGALSYGELARRSGRLARQLRRRGVGPEVTVALCFEPGCDMVTAILGVLGAGGAYLPLDPALPPERLHFILADSRAPLLLHGSGAASIAAARAAAATPETIGAAAATAAAGAAWPLLLSLDGGWLGGEESPEDDRGQEPDGDGEDSGRGLAAGESLPASAAYVIYTSGSTGAPKGVVVTHANASRLFSATRDRFGFGASDVWTLFHSYAFDFSVWELWGALLHGGRLVVVPYLVSRSPEALVELLERERVTVLNQTPSAFYQLVACQERLGRRVAPSLAWVIFGGEALAAARLAPWLARRAGEGPRLVNMYGITETTVHVTWRFFSAPPGEGEEASGGERRGDPIAASGDQVAAGDGQDAASKDRVSGGAGQDGASGVGRPLPDLAVYLLDRRLEPQPFEVAGELCVGGAGVARGYPGRPELTAERFVPDPFGDRPGGRLYRSGDLARFSPHGELEYLGRIDRQVKLRGFRIELGEIESALAGHPGVQQAAVVARPVAAWERAGQAVGAAANGPGGDALRLVAYVVPAGPEEAGGQRLAAALRDHLSARLPAYMVPAAFVQLAALPLTGNGKLDAAALPAPAEDRPDLEVAYVAPATWAEQTLSAIWAQTLGVDQVGVHDNFFALGGDSIRTLQVLAVARERGLDLTLPDLFRHQTVAEQAALAATAGDPEREAGRQRRPSAPFCMIGEEDRRRLPADAEDAYPITRLQLGMLYHMELSADYPLYHNVASFSTPLPIEPELFRRAVRQTVARHPILRTSFDLSSYSEPLQIVHAQAEMPLLFEDLSELEPADQARLLDAYVAAEKRRLFDLAQPPLLRFAVHRLSAERIQFTLTECHPILDGWSLNSTLVEIGERYLGLLEDPDLPLAAPPPLGFRDYVLLERAAAEDPASRDWWERRLAGATVFELPRRGGRPPGSPVCDLRLTLSEEVTAGLRRLARTSALPVKSVFLAAHLKVLALLSGQEDVLTGLVIHGRPEEPGGDQVRGLMLNTVPFRLRLPAGSWRQLVRATFEAERELLPHRRYPISALQRERGMQPLYQTSFNFTNFHVWQSLARRGSFADAPIGFAKELEETEVPLFVNFNFNVNGRLRLAVYAALSDAQTLAIQGYYLRALAGLAAAPDEDHDGASLLSPAERHQILVEWSGAGAARPGPALQGLAPRPLRVDARALALARRQPAAPALVAAGGRTLSYGEVERLSGLLARRLRALGVGGEARVGIYLRRGWEQAVALLAVLRAEGCCLPLDPAQPAARLALMLEDASATVVVTRRALLADAPTARRVRRLALEEVWPEEGESQAAPEPAAASARQHDPAGAEDPGALDRLAYLIYTSGSTGQPKGVALCHRTLANLIDWQVATSSVPAGRTLQFASPGFDVSLQEVFATWCGGGSLVVASDEDRADPGRLLATLAETRVERLFLPWVALQQLAEAAGAAGARLPAAVREIVTAGEQLRVSPEVAALLAALPGCLLRNQYGPSETHVVTEEVLAGVPSSWPLLPPIGRAIQETSAYVLSAAGQPLPAGSPGELWLAGAALARGYLGRPELTAERFAPDPFSRTPGGRLYRTGDLARFRHDGALEFLGRADLQIKVRGFRIELGEVEAALAAAPGVAEAAAWVQGEGTARRLVGYLVPATQLDAADAPGAPPAAAGLTASPLPATSAAGLDLAAVRAFLRQRLPEPMVPPALVVLPALPLTASGKLDRRSLPPPGAGDAAPARPATPPRDDLERHLAEVWTEVLGIAPRGLEDGFFELGGHSLSATRAISRVRAGFGVELPLRSLFDAPTLGGFAERIRRELAGRAPSRGAGGAGRDADVRSPAAPRVVRALASSGQRRLWFLDQLEPGRAAYNLPTVLRLRGELDPAALAGALEAVVRRHGSLRTTFAAAGGEPEQLVAPAAAGELLPVAGLDGLPAGPRDAEARRLTAELATRPFDLARGPMLRTLLVRLSGREHLLLLVLHHIAGDGWSLGILLGELAALYAAGRARQPSPLPEPVWQYTDFARWQLRRLEGPAGGAEMDWWRRRLLGLPPLLSLPTDRPRPVVRSGAGGARRLVLPAASAAPLLALAQRQTATPFMAFLSLLAVLLGRLSGEADLAVATPVSGRSRVELEGLIGFFVNTLVLRLDLAGDPTFGALLERVREAALEAFTHQEVPFEKLVEELLPERSRAHTPLFQVLFSLLGAPAQPPRLAGLDSEAEDSPLAATKTDLQLDLQPLPDGGLAGTLVYSRDLFDASTVERWLGHFERLLAGAAADPRRPISELPLLDAAQRTQLLTEHNATGAAYPRERSLAARFAELARRQPEAPALSWPGAGDREECRVSYGELGAWAWRLAARLAELGLPAEGRVALLLERSPEMVAAMLAVLAAGGCYLPLDPAHPPERLVWLLRDAGARLVIATPDLAAQLPPDAAAEWLLVAPGDVGGGVSATVQTVAPGDLGGESGTFQFLAPELLADHADRLACIMYTSGSTGVPKGVAVSHGAIGRLVASADLAPLGPGDRVAQAANPAFDAASFEVWGALLNGACLVGLAPRTLLAPGELAATLARLEIGTLFLTTALFNQIAREASAAFAPLNHLLVGGEAADPRRMREVLAAGGPRRLVHVYGPTESTTFAAWHRVECVPPGAPTVAVGRPLANTRLHVLDRRLEPQPPGVTGELYIGGLGLARGYLGRPDLTAERFLPDPHGAAGERLYRTGDLARRLASGELEIVGRTDRQLKVRGFRIEPAEIEAALGSHPRVAAAAVLAVGEPDEPAGRRLVAFVTPAGEGGPAGEAEPAGIGEWLRRRLPAHLVPAAILELATLPLTPSGKLDRRALARLARERPEAAEAGDTAPFAAPRDGVEREIAAIWRELLGRDRIGVHDQFFALGGHSLLAVRALSRLRAAFGVELPVADLFDAPTLGGLAERVRAALDAPQAEPAPALADLGQRGQAAGIPRAAAASERYPTLGGLAERVRAARRDQLGRAAGIPRTAAASERYPAPLSFGQLRLWFLDRLEPGAALYNLPLAVRVAGPLDAGALADAFGEVLRRHEALRVRFEETDGEPVQLLGEAAAPPVLPLVDLSGLGGAEAEARRISREEARRPFDLRTGPLFRPRLLRLSPRDHQVLATVHHIACDGWSLSVLVGELAALYDRERAVRQGAPGQTPLPELPVQYADFARWQRRRLAGEALAGQLAHWRERLAGLPERLPLPWDRQPLEAASRVAGASFSGRLPAAIAPAVRGLALAHGASTFMVLLAVFQALLGRVCGVEDLAVGAPAAGRARQELEGLIGFFVNTLVLRGDLRGEPALRDLLPRVRATALDAQAHQDVPFERLVEELQPARSLSHAPLFQVMFALQNAPRGELEASGLNFQQISLPAAVTQFELSLDVFEEDGDLWCSWTWSSDLFDATTVRRLAGHFETLLARAVAAPDLPLSELSLLGEAERHQLAVEWPAALPRPTAAIGPGGDLELAAGLTLHGLVAGRAGRQPEAVAVVEEAGGTLTYGELERRADELAGRLRAAGIAAEESVGLCLERSAASVIAQLAVLKAGGAIVPLDPAQPPARRAAVLRAAGARLLLGEARRAGGTGISCQLLAASAAAREPGVEGASRPGEAASTRGGRAGRAAAGSLTADERGEGGQQGDQLAYLIFTSGSTGTPKGVAVAHQAAAADMLAVAGAFELRPADRVLQLASPSFDAAVEETFATLLSGAVLVLPGELWSPGDYLERAAVLAITVGHATPAYWEQMVGCEAERAAGGGAAPPSCLRLMNVGGEAMPPRAARLWPRVAGGVPLLNIYGPAEAVVSATWFRVPGPGSAGGGSWQGQHGGAVPIGRPLSGMSAHVVDVAGEPVPAGVAGELWLGGLLARGYLAEPALTAERFVPDPWSGWRGRGTAFRRLYRTGDRVRFLADGTLQFLGRIDSQVKIRGIRIEPGEVEAALASHPAVSHAAVVARAGPAAAERPGPPEAPGGEPELAGRSLAAWVVPRSPGSGTAGLPAELRSWLRQRLPEALVPAEIAVVGALPLTVSGKVDRRALSGLRAMERAEQAAQAPPTLSPGRRNRARDPVETALAGLWAEVLGPGWEDRASGSGAQDFFAAGGHSLLATRLVSRIRRTFGVEVPLRALFAEPSLGGMAGLVARALAAAGGGPAEKGSESAQGVEGWAGGAEGTEEPAGAPRAVGRVRRAPVRRAPVREGEATPLSFAQERLWLLAQLEGRATADYNMPVAARLSGALRPALLAAVLTEISRRHAALRTTFHLAEGLPVQIVAPAGPVPLPLVDLSGLSGLPGAGGDEEARGRLLEALARPFDLSRGPLFGALLFRLAGDEHLVALNMHHIVSDGWSLEVLLGEMRALYAAASAGQPSPLPELPIQYPDYALWQRRRLSGEVLARELAFWRRELAGAPPLLELPLSRPRPALQTTRGAAERLTLSPELSEAVARLARREGATPFMVVLAAFEALLARVSGQTDFVVGSPIAGRHRLETEGLIGFFLNTLPLRARLGGDPSFDALVAAVRETTLSAYAHQDLPFERLVEELRPPRDLARTPIFQVMLNWLAFNADPVPSAEQPGLRLEMLTTGPPRARFDLEVYGEQDAESILLHLVYNRDLFESGQMRQLAGLFERLLASAAAGPERRLSDLELGGGEESVQTRLASGPAVAPWSDTSLHGRFLRVAAQHGERVALRPEGGLEAGPAWTYAELRRQARRIAHALIETAARAGTGGAAAASAHGLLGQRVALLLPHGEAMVAAVLGALEAGAAYVPLDPSHPPARLRSLLEDARPAVLVCLGSGGSWGGGGGAAGGADGGNGGHGQADLPLLDLEELFARGELAEPPPGWQGPAVPASAPAYLLYTSGSTGRPKAVMQSHGGVLGHIQAYGEGLSLQPDDRLTLLPGAGFDAAVMDLFGALLHGAELCPWDVRARGVAGLGAWLAARGVTIYHSTPSVFRALLESLNGAADLPALRRVVLGGEEVLRGDLERCRAVLGPACGLVNGYGPTESTLALRRVFRPAEEPERPGLPLGRPVAGIDVLLHNGVGEQEALWGMGEILIRSPWLAAGYWRQADLTAAAFLPDPGGRAAGGRLYRSGDLGRRLPGGEIEFAGRLDHQVKIRGHRVEPAEIEAALAADPAVRQAAVVAHPGAGGEPRLVAFFAPGAQAEVARLRRRLAERLPEPLLPALLVPLPALPLTATGKIDRMALGRLLSAGAERGEAAGREPGDGRDPAAGRAPRGPLGEVALALAALWRELLAAGDVGADDNFFELGGHSLLAIRLLSRVQAAFGVTLPLREVFLRPTLAELAEGVEQARQRATVSARGTDGASDADRAGAAAAAPAEEPGAKGPVRPMKIAVADRSARRLRRADLDPDDLLDSPAPPDGGG